jgi:hypothetical protein
MMGMRRAGLVAIPALAGVLLGAGCAAGSPGNRGAASAGTGNLGSETAAGASADGGAVQVYEYADSDGAGASVILTGAVGDFGAAVSVYPDGAIDPQHDSQVNLALTKGSFRIGVAALDKKIVSDLSHFRPDPRTCSGVVRATATTPVVPGSGTGAYRGIGGSFRLTVTIAEIVPKSRCDGTGALLGQAVITTGTGRVSLG